MALSSLARKMLRIAFCKLGPAKEVADAIDAATSGETNLTAAAVVGVAGSGTNQAGAAFTVDGGPGTGTGLGGNVGLRTAYAGTTGTTANTLATRISAVAKRYALTNAGANLLTFPLAALGQAAFSLHYTIRCTDGTDLQTLSGHVNIAAVNKAGAATTHFTDASSLAASAGTLTLAWSATLAANVGTLTLTPTTSLTPTTFDINFVIVNSSGVALTLL